MGEEPPKATGDEEFDWDGEKPPNLRLQQEVDDEARNDDGAADSSSDSDDDGGSSSDYSDDDDEAAGPGLRRFKGGRSDSRTSLSTVHDDDATGDDDEVVAAPPAVAGVSSGAAGDDDLDAVPDVTDSDDVVADADADADADAFEETAPDDADAFDETDARHRGGSQRCLQDACPVILAKFEDGAVPRRPTWRKSRSASRSPFRASAGARAARGRASRGPRRRRRSGGGEEGSIELKKSAFFKLRSVPSPWGLWG